MVEQVPLVELALLLESELMAAWERQVEPASLAVLALAVGQVRAVELVLLLGLELTAAWGCRVEQLPGVLALVEQQLERCKQPAYRVESYRDWEPVVPAPLAGSPADRAAQQELRPFQEMVAAGLAGDLLSAQGAENGPASSPVHFPDQITVYPSPSTHF